MGQCGLDADLMRTSVHRRPRASRGFRNKAIPLLRKRDYGWPWPVQPCRAMCPRIDCGAVGWAIERTDWRLGLAGPSSAKAHPLAGGLTYRLAACGGHTHTHHPPTTSLTNKGLYNKRNRVTLADMIKITETLHYDPITGNAWYTIPKNYSRILTAKDTSGYIHAKVGEKKHRLHRLVWEKINGPIPDGMQIDHIDCNKRNNAMSNLRVVDRLTNARNRKPPVNASGYPGVHWRIADKRWYSDVSVGNKIVWMASNRDARVLYNKYREAKIKFHGEDSVRHYPQPIDTSRFTIAPTKPYYVGHAGRGKVKCHAPKPHRYDYKWSVTHRGKRVFTTSSESEARDFAVNLRNELDNKRASSTTQP